MEDVKIKAKFQALDLHVSLTREFFDMLDGDGDGVVDIDEFIEGCVRLRGGARSVDVVMVLFHCERLCKQVKSLQRKSHEQMDMLNRLANSSKSRLRMLT